MTDIFSFFFNKKKGKSSPPLAATEVTSNENAIEAENFDDDFTFLPSAQGDQETIQENTVNQRQTGDYETLFSFLKVGENSQGSGIPVRPARKAPAPPLPGNQQSLLMTPVDSDSNPLLVGVPFCLHRNLSAKHAFNDAVNQMNVLGAKIKTRNDSLYNYDFKVEMEVIREAENSQKSHDGMQK